MKIGIDVMGGDYAPEECFKGIKSYIEEVNRPDVHFLLVGDQEKCTPFLSELAPYTDRYTFVHASQVIEMDEHPTKALKEKQDSSIAVGFGLMLKGMSDAFISAGNTGAMLVGAMYTIKAVRGVHRPTIASVMPNVAGQYNLILDVGANADLKPENLVQLAQMGDIYAKKIFGIENPKIGLLNIGEEEGKGNILTQATYPLLKELKSINFIGNVEGRDVLLDTANVIVCEGFVGNVVLKMAESFYHIFKLQKHIQDDLLDALNYEIYGGTPILGVNAPVIIGHGISNGRAFNSMIAQAVKCVDTELIKEFQQVFGA